MRPATFTPAAWFAAICILLPSSMPVWGQLVQIGPGYVRAPFVEIHSYPDGSSHVRAPFVSVHSPPRYAPRPHYVPAPTVTRVLPAISDSREDLGELDWRSLRQTIRQAAARLDQALNALPTRAEWRTYLRISRLQELTSGTSDGPPQDFELVQLEEISDRYAATARAANLRRITNLAGFQTVARALAELVSPPLDRQLRLLTSASDRLQRDLQSRGAGTAWQDFLRLPSALNDSAAGQFPSPPGEASDQAEQLQDLYARYEQVDQEPRYRQIAGLPGFRTTYRRLTEYLALLGESDGSEIEQLPPPLPIPAKP